MSRPTAEERAFRIILTPRTLWDIIPEIEAAEREAVRAFAGWIRRKVARDHRQRQTDWCLAGRCSCGSYEDCVSALLAEYEKSQRG